MDKKRKPIKYPEVRIDWLDSCSITRANQFSIDQALDLSLLLQSDYGLLLGFNRSRTAYVLATNISSEGQVRGITLVDKRAVVGKKIMGWRTTEVD